MGETPKHIRLPMLPESRPVDPNWKCQHSGDCCEKVPEVVMTTQEAKHLVLHAPPTITLHFRPTDEANFVAMKAGPCPLHIFNRCIVYEHRPYNCRRFGCMRPDVKAEPFEIDGSNLHDRTMTSRPARRLAIKIQRKAQHWARKMGWGNV